MPCKHLSLPVLVHFLIICSSFVLSIQLSLAAAAPPEHFTLASRMENVRQLGSSYFNAGIPLIGEHSSRWGINAAGHSYAVDAAFYGARRGRRLSSVHQAGSGQMVLQSYDEEQNKTSTLQVDEICYSRGIDGIVNPYTGEFLDNGRSTEEIWEEMKAKSLAPGRAKALESFSTMVEDGQFDMSIVRDNFPVAAAIYIVAGVLILLFLLFCLGPLACCSCCRRCCCCVRRRSHKTRSRTMWYIIFGTCFALIAVGMAIAGYRVDKKVLDETTAVVCAGGRSVDELLYGTRIEGTDTERQSRQTFGGIKNIMDGTQRLLDAADGDNPDNFVSHVKREILAAVDIAADKAQFGNAADASLKNIEETKDIVGKASHRNIFVDEKYTTITPLLGSIKTKLQSVDIATDISDAFESISLPSVDRSGLAEGEKVIETLSDMTNSVGDASHWAEYGIHVLDALFLSISVVSGGLAILAVIFLVWTLYRPNKCLRRGLVFMSVVLTLLAALTCILVAVASVLHKVGIPVCDYATVRFMDVNSSHILAKLYGEDSEIFEVAKICLSATGSGELLQNEDGSNQIDELVETLESKRKEICNSIPEPEETDFNFLDFKNLDEDARHQSWAVLSTETTVGTFEEIIQSGIQDLDSTVTISGSKKKIYGMESARSAIRPWRISISNASNPGSLIITSEAPTDEQLNQWATECNKAKGQVECDKVKAGVPILKKRISLLISPAQCYSSSSGSVGRPCSVKELMGGSGESSVPQNALDRSVTAAADSVKRLRVKIETSKDAACAVADESITTVQNEVLKLKQGSNCKFTRDRMIRLTNHLCYNAIDSLSTVTALYFILALAMMLLVTVLLILIIELRDNDKYGSTQCAPAEDHSVEKAGSDVEAPVEAKPEETKEADVDGAVDPDTVHEVPPAASEDPEAAPHSPESASKEDLKATEEGP